MRKKKKGPLLITVVDRVWARMERGMRVDGTVHPTAIVARRKGLPARGAYNFLPHSSKRSRLRRLRQVYRGQLTEAQFQNATQYHGAKMVYLDLVSRGAA